MENKSCLKKKGQIIFTVILLTSSLFFWILALISKDLIVYLDKYFIPGVFEDFYNPMMKLKENTYVDPHFSDYPPLANMFFLFVRKFFSKNEIKMAFKQEKLIDGARYFRGIDTGLILTAVFFVVTFILFYVIIDAFFSKYNKKINKYTLMAIMFSGPFIFILERGNIIILSLIFSSIFLMYYQSDNKIVKELALISLGLATAFKIYPIVLIILLFNRKHFKDAVRVLVYCTIFLVLPFGFYGWDNFPLFIKNLFNRNTYKVTSIYGYNYNISYQNTIRLIANIFTKKQIIHIPKFLYIFPILSLAYTFIFNTKSWIKMSAAAMIFIWIPASSYKYLVCFLIVPVMLFFNSEKESKHKIFDLMYIIEFTLMFISYNLPRLDNFITGISSRLQVTVGAIIMCVSILAFVITMLADTITNDKIFLKSGSART